MVKITFKNVGQGDSILLEWESNGINRIGIIDCNLYQNSNPVLDHIIENRLLEIEFLILSHPHLDHFSGYFELLNYFRDNKISVKRFLHTSYMTKEYLMSASRSIIGATELSRLYGLLKEMRQNNELDVFIIDANPDLKIPIGDNFFLEALAPSALESDKYARSVQYPFDEEISSANPNANWLSTVLRLFNSEINVILTSDSEKNILSRIGGKNTGRLGNEKLVLAQIPHHGSKKNLNKTFWQMRKRPQNTPVVISVGMNNYNHPAIEVIDFFERLNGYCVERTDDGVVSKMSEIGKQISRTLDVFSKKSHKNPLRLKLGDKVFELSGKTCSAV